MRKIELIEKGILKGANRQEKNWSRLKFGEPFKKSLDNFRKNVLGRNDFDPTSLLQFGLFMSMAVINMLKENEKNFGVEGQKAANQALKQIEELHYIAEFKQHGIDKIIKVGIAFNGKQLMVKHTS